MIHYIFPGREAFQEDTDDVIVCSVEGGRAKWRMRVTATEVEHLVGSKVHGRPLNTPQEGIPQAVLDCFAEPEDLDA